MRRGFTLIELIIAITILGILSALISGNFFTSLKKGRDARRKADLEQTQRALELYYEDKKAYPTGSASPGFPFGSQFCETSACASSEKIYMQKVSSDPISTNNYLYESSDGSNYKMYTCIENALDQGSGVNQSGYTGKDCGACGTCKYGISSPNTTP